MTIAIIIAAISLTFVLLLVLKFRHILWLLWAASVWVVFVFVEYHDVFDFDDELDPFLLAGVIYLIALSSFALFHKPKDASVSGLVRSFIIRMEAENRNRIDQLASKKDRRAADQPPTA